MKDWHKLVLVYIAGRKTPATPENIKQYLKKHEISKSHTAITTACKQSLSDVLACHDHSTYNDDDTVKLKRFKYSLKDGFLTLYLIVKSLKHPYTQQTFMKSDFYRDMIPGIVNSFSRSFVEIGLTTIDIEHAGDDPNLVKNLKKTCAGRHERYYTDGVESVKRAIKAVESGKYDKELIVEGRTKKDVVAGFKKELAEHESYDPDPPYTFSDSELKDITKALEKNWTMLRFIVYYLGADNETKRERMLKLVADSRSGTVFAARATAVGFMSLFTREHIRKYNQKSEKGIFDDALHRAGVTTPLNINPDPAPSPVVTDQIGYNLLQLGGSYDDLLGAATKKTIEVLTGYTIKDLPKMWFAEWFAELDVIRDRSPFLFD